MSAPAEIVAERLAEWWEPVDVHGSECVVWVDDVACDCGAGG